VAKEVTGDKKQEDMKQSRTQFWEHPRQEADTRRDTGQQSEASLGVKAPPKMLTSSTTGKSGHQSSGAR
jgi:hypothetical protein